MKIIKNPKMKLVTGRKVKSISEELYKRLIFHFIRL